MLSFGRWAAATALVAALLPGVGRTQSTQSADLYQQARAREAALRKQLDAAPSSSTAANDLLERLRILTGTYEDLWRLFPTSGYSDNALWQGALLAADAFWEFGDPADRATSLRLLQALTANFPTSSLIKQVPAQVKRLEAASTSPVGRTLLGPPGEADPSTSSGSSRAQSRDDKPRPTTLNQRLTTACGT